MEESTMNPFKEQPLRQPGFFRRLFGRPIPENAYIAVENLLARDDDWNSLHEGHVSNLLRAHGVKNFDHSRATKIYEKAVAEFLGDEALSDSETQNLLQLQRLLGITNADLEEIEQRVVHPVYRRAIEDVLSDEIVEPKERERLNTLRQALRLDEERAVRMYAFQTGKIVGRRLADAIADKRISDDEVKSLEDRARNLGAALELDSLLASTELDRFRSFWRMENGIYSEVEVPINLHRGERCHFSSGAIWYERRTITKSVRYAGIGGSLRIMKGLHYRSGSYQVQRITQEETRQISSGTVYITSKRIVFHGQPKSGAIRFDSIVSFIPYADGIEIEKTSGRNPIFTFSDGEYASVLLSALLAQN
jgi:hypothetical protein